MADLTYQRMGKKTSFLHVVELLETTFQHTQGVQYWNLRPGEGAVLLTKTGN